MPKFCPALFTSLLIATFGVTSTAQAVTVCLYVKMANAYELTEHCGDALDAQSQQRFDQEIAKLAEFNIKNNPRLDWHISAQRWSNDYRQMLHKNYLSSDKSNCETHDYAYWRNFLIDSTSAKGVSRIDDAIRRQGRPDLGSCDAGPLV